MWLTGTGSRGQKLVIWDHFRGRRKVWREMAARIYRVAVLLRNALPQLDVHGTRADLFEVLFSTAAEEEALRRRMHPTLFKSTVPKHEKRRE